MVSGKIMKIERFEDIVAWQKARKLTNLWYGLLRNNRDYGFRDQIFRACISIMNNIAEGFERRGDKEFKKFLYISKGSCAEVRSMTYIAGDLNYIKQTEISESYALTLEISKMLSGFIKKLTY